ncbi:helix-turn-helix domain-containing protein [Pseudoroseomonas cervicalis]|uniref:helix-turn-helix domain-containing protein n=1 Tax=Teichococcus cervicalis TaxID=204525 RepID=UPI002788AA22|nr:helix-turn-helix domain-containing protein [Pseudoroseomonas cervicalis]MDQ1077933.1 transcriptional regulator with XRE-family HTH domain [Pseudoroseomonas cervicalis]
MRNQADRTEVLAHVAENLRRFRQRAGLSQSALAAASGLSRRMIVSLEGGETNISLASLDRLAEALGVSFVQMVSHPQADPGRVEALAWRGASPDSRATLLGSVPARSWAELWSWSLAPGERYAAGPAPSGWHAMIAVTEGRLRLELAEGIRQVPRGDFTIFDAAQRFAYVNDGEETVRFLCHVVA